MTTRTNIPTRWWTDTPTHHSTACTRSRCGVRAWRARVKTRPVDKICIDLKQWAYARACDTFGVFRNFPRRESESRPLFPGRCLTARRLLVPVYFRIKNSCCHSAEIHPWLLVVPAKWWPIVHDRSTPFSKRCRDNSGAFSCEGKNVTKMSHLSFSD